MGESSTPETPKNFLDVGIIAILTVAANHSLPAQHHTEATTVIPFVGGGIAWVIRKWRRHRAFMQLVALETRWLNETIADRNQPGLSEKRQQELDAEISERRQALRDLQRDNIKVQ